jgi:hypothetical protein
MKKRRFSEAQVIGIFWEKESPPSGALKMMHAPFEGAFIKAYP